MMMLRPRGGLLLQPLICLFAAQIQVGAQTTFQPAGVPFKSPVSLAPGYTASVLFSNLTTPRGITFDGAGNLLVVERGFGVTAFTRVSQPTEGWERTVVIPNVGFTQGIQVDGSKLYVSTAGDTFQYEYDASTKSVSAVVQPFSIITGIPPDGDLTTHTLQLERDQKTGKAIALLVATGPKTNIDVTARDPTSGRSQIRRFLLPVSDPTTTPPSPAQWNDGQILAFGIRNPAGFAFPPNGLGVPALGGGGPHLASARSLLVVENGASIDNATGLTKAFVNDNPADEINLVSYSTEIPPVSYGFPDCTSLWNASADPTGDPQFVGKPRGFQFSLELEPSRDDAWCQNSGNNRPPILSFAAHSVPLDIKFYEPHGPISSSGAFPHSSQHHAFVSFHGSFNRIPPTGYGVVDVPFPIPPHSSQSVSDLGYSFIIQAANLNTCPGSCIRPVGLAFGADGRLYVSSDSSREVRRQINVSPEFQVNGYVDNTQSSSFLLLNGFK